MTTRNLKTVLITTQLPPSWRRYAVLSVSTETFGFFFTTNYFRYQLFKVLDDQELAFDLIRLDVIFCTCQRSLGSGSYHQFISDIVAMEYIVTCFDVRITVVCEEVN